MSLSKQIVTDLTAAMKAQDAARTSTLRMVKAAMMNRQIEKGSELDDGDMKKLDVRNSSTRNKRRSTSSKPTCRRPRLRKRSNKPSPQPSPKQARIPLRIWAK